MTQYNPEDWNIKAVFNTLYNLYMYKLYIFYFLKKCTRQKMYRLYRFFIFNAVYMVYT